MNGKLALHSILRFAGRDNLLHSAHFAGFKAHIDAMRMMGGICQDILHDSARSFSSALVLLLDDVNFQPRFYVFSILAVHISLAIISAPFSSHSASMPCACLTLAGASL